MKSAVVTGAARGFGLEIARRLVDRGHFVVLCDVDAHAVEAAAASLGDRAVGIEADVREKTSVRPSRERLRSSLKPSISFAARPSAVEATKTGWRPRSPEVK
jgi:NAD(P)-dependent dehydrogenase (short-subunit alcohol dehydrogenase family)